MAQRRWQTGVWTEASLDQALQQYHNDLRAQGYAASTIYAYDDGAARFVRYLRGEFTPARMATHENGPPYAVARQAS